MGATMPSERAAIEFLPRTPVLNLGNFDSAALGYVVEEYLLSGQATSYNASGPIGADGRWDAVPASTAPFTTRLVVLRPAKADGFNGAVVVEWLNVSGGLDAGPDWLLMHREIIRSGFAYVGVSVQKVGVDGGPSLGLSALPLKQADPARYGRLTHPGDAFAYDIFSQAGAALRDGLVGACPTPERLLAVGESQSALFLTTYINAIDPIASVYDGYIVHSRFGGAAPIDGTSIFGGPTGAMPAAARLRDDLRAPVLTLITETDLVGGQLNGFLAARQPDSERLRIWEIAGTAHADTYMMAAGNLDFGETPIAQLAAAYAPTDTVLGAKLDKPINSAPQHHYVAAAALAALDRWVSTGEAPARAEPIVTIAGAGPQLALDANGNARGGVRSPWVDVPTARLSGVGNSGGVMAFLVGVTEPFDGGVLASLYPGGQTEYLRKFNASLKAAVAAGYILEADEAEISALASVTYGANQGP